MINFKRLDHFQICIPAGKEAEARQFYTNVLGLKEIPPPEELASISLIWFEVADIQLHIGTENSINNSVRHPAFQVTDIDDARTHLEKHEVHIIEEIQIAGRKRFAFLDPFNNRIELLEKD